MLSSSFLHLLSVLVPLGAGQRDGGRLLRLGRGVRAS